MSSNENKRSRKVLIPLATMSVAAAVMIGSGATWTSESKSTVSVTAGKIVHVNNHDKGTLTVTRLKPGSEVSGTVKISEDAKNDLDADLKIVASNVTSAITADDLLIKIAGNGVDTGFVNFETLDVVELGRVDDGYGARNIVFTIKMPADAGNENQGQAASVDLQFVTTTTTDAESGTTVSWN